MKISRMFALAAALATTGALAEPASKSKLAAAPRAPVVTPFLETIFEPIQPCRAFDTRASNGGGPLVADQGRAFTIAGTTGFGTQGGPARGCGIPDAATAVALSLTSSGSTANGRIAAYPFQAGVSPTTALSFSPSLNTTTGVTVGLTKDKLTLRATGGSTQIAGDVTGYFAPQIQVYVNADGSIFSLTPRITGAKRIGTGAYTVTVDRDVLYCAGTANPSDGGLIANANTVKDNTVYVYTYGLTNGAFISKDAGFNLVVHC